MIILLFRALSHFTKLMQCIHHYYFLKIEQSQLVDLTKQIALYCLTFFSILTELSALFFSSDLNKQKGKD
jgi:hypothetical protein